MDVIGGCKHEGNSKGHWAIGTSSIMKEPGLKQGILILCSSACTRQSRSKSRDVAATALSAPPSSNRTESSFFNFITDGVYHHQLLPFNQEKSKVLFECDCATAIRFLELTCCPPRHVLERTSSLRSSSNNGRHAQRRGPFRFPPLYSTRWPFGSCRRDRPSYHRRHSIRHGNASTACSSGREGFQRRRKTITGNYKRHAAAGSISNGEDSGRGLFWQGEAGHSSAQWAPGCPQNYFPPQVAL